MKKFGLFFLGLAVSVSFFVGGCASSQSKKEVSQLQKQTIKEVKIKKECKNYISKMENCLKNAEGKDYTKVWKQCEGKVMWDMLKEYQDNGFCFDEDECKQKVLEEINRCLEERNYIYKKYMK